MSKNTETRGAEDKSPEAGWEKWQKKNTLVLKPMTGWCEGIPSTGSKKEKKNQQPTSPQL